RRGDGIPDPRGLPPRWLGRGTRRLRADRAIVPSERAARTRDVPRGRSGLLIEPPLAHWGTVARLILEYLRPSGVPRPPSSLAGPEWEAGSSLGARREESAMAGG